MAIEGLSRKSPVLTCRRPRMAILDFDTAFQCVEAVDRGASPRDEACGCLSNVPAVSAGGDILSLALIGEVYGSTEGN